MTYSYTKKESAWLIVLGGVGFLGLNSIFVYALVFSPYLIVEAMKNPVSLVFIVELFLLLATFTYLLKKWGVLRISRTWFIVLALIGGLAFALPIAILFKSDKKSE